MNLVKNIGINALFALGTAALAKGIEKIVEAVDNYIHRFEIARETIATTAEEIEKINDSFKETEKTTSDVAKRFAELSQEVNQMTGENKTLNTEEYKEFLDLSKQIAEIFPSLPKIYNENGEAIVQLTGDVDGIVGSLQSLVEVQRQLANQEIADKLPDLYKSAVKSNEGYDNQIEDAQNTLKQIEEAQKLFDLQKIKNAIQKGSYDRSFLLDVDEMGLIDNFYSDLFKKLGWYSAKAAYEFDSRNNVEGFKVTIPVGIESIENTTEQELEVAFNQVLTSYQQKYNKLTSDIVTYTNGKESEWSKVSQSLFAWLYTDSGSGYALMEGNLQAGIQKIINSLDYDSLMEQYPSDDDLKNYILTNIIYPVRDDKEVKEALNSLLSLDFSNMSIKDANEQINKFINFIADKLKIDPLELKVQFGNYDELYNYYHSVIDSAAKKATTSIKGRNKQYEYKEIYGKIESFAEEYSINTQEEIAAFDKALDEAEGDINKAFELYLQDKTEREQLLISKEALDNAKSYRDELGKLYDALALLRSGNATASDIYGFIEEFPGLSEYVGDLELLEEKIQELVNERLVSLRESFNGVIGEEELRRLSEYSVKLGAIDNNIDTAISSINSITDAYKTLSDAVEEYNEKGYISLETLEDIMTMKPEYINMLMDENGELKKTSDAYRDYIKLKISDLKASTWDKVNELKKVEYKIYRDKVDASGLEWGSDTVQGWLKEYQDKTREIEETYFGASSVQEKYLNSLLENLEKVVEDELDKDVKTYSQQIDWAANSVSNLEREVSNLEQTHSNAKGYQAQIEALDLLIEKQGVLRSAYESSAKTYEDKYLTVLNSDVLKNAELTDTVRQAIESDEKFNIQDFVKENVKANEENVVQQIYESIQEAIDWYNKHTDAEDNAIKLGFDIDENAFSKVDLVIKKFNNQLSTYENQANMIEARLVNAEARGQIATQQYYRELQNIERNRLSELEGFGGKLEALQAELASGKIKEGSDEWYELSNNIAETELEIQNAKNALVDFDNEIRQIDWDLFDFARDQESKLMNEADFMIDLLDSAKMFSEAGEITAEGMATMGLHAFNYNAYLEQSIDYAKEYKNIQEELAKDPYNTDLIERRNEILELQQESILTAESEKDAMISLVSDGIELQKDAFKDLIDQRIETLELEKDIYDQQKKNAEQTKKIANLQKQLAAYSGDSSDEARAKVQQLKVKLEEEQSTLESDNYDRYLSDQKEILNTIYEDYETALDSYLDDTAKVISDSIDATNRNASNIGKTVTKATNDVGYEVKYWNDGKGVLASNFKGVNENIQDNNKVLGDIKDNITGLIDAQKEAITSSLKDLSAKGAIGQTITEIKGVLETISTQIGGIKTGGSDDFGAGGETNLDPIPQPTGNSNAGSSGVNFTQNKSSYNKNKLNKNTSVVDFLKYYDIDSSDSARADYYKQMGLEDIYGKFNPNDSTQNIAMLNWLKENEDKIKGYASGGFNLKKQMVWTQENGDLEYIIRKSDGAILTRVNPGDMVLNSDASKNLWSMANNPASFFADIVKGGLVVDIPSSTSNGNMVQIDNLAINVPLENVTDVNSFLREFQRNPKVEAVIKDVIASSMTGNNSLSKYRHKF